MAQLNFAFAEEERNIPPFLWGDFHFRRNEPFQTFEQEYPPPQSLEACAEHLTLTPYKGDDWIHTELYTRRMAEILQRGRNMAQERQAGIDRRAYHPDHWHMISRRGTGRTSKQIWDLDHGGLFIVQTTYLARDLQRQLAFLGRLDVRVENIDFVRRRRWYGCRFTAVAADHSLSEDWGGDYAMNDFRMAYADMLNTRRT